MDIVIFSENDDEFTMLSEILTKEIPSLYIKREIDDGQYHFSREYDAAVVAFRGANGMEYVREYSMRFPKTLVVWITDDKYFAGEAIRRHICDFIVRPYDRERFRETAIKLASELGKNGAVSKVIGGTPTL